MILIKKVKLFNFASAKELKYKFDRPGLNTIQGRNGAGKTTIFNGLMWVLYGITLKKGCSIYPWPTLVGREYDGVKGVVEIVRGDIEIEIIRTAEYKGKVKGKKMKSGIMIVEQGKINESLRNKADAQKYILSLLGYTPELFKNSVVFGQRLKRLMEEDNATKKKIMEEAFEIGFLAKAKEIVEAKLKSLEDKCSSLDDRVTLLDVEAKARQETYENLKGVVDAFDRTKDKKLEDLEASKKKVAKAIREIKPQLKELPRLKDKLSKYENLNIKSLKDEEFRLDMQLKSRQGDIEKLKTEISRLKDSFLNPDRTCDICGANLPKDKVKAYREKIKASINKFKLEISALQKEIDGKKGRYNWVTSRLSSLNDKEKDIENMRIRIKVLEKLHQEYLSAKALRGVLANQIKETQEMVCEITSQKLSNLQADIKKVCKRKDRVYKKLKDKLEQKEIQQWLLKDPLSNGGIKSFIIESMVGYVNKELGRLQSLIGFKIVLAVNLDSAHKDMKIRVFKDNQEVPYEDLSGGQQQLVDVSIAFAMNSIVENSKPINILLLDEVFESLDESNVEVVARILQEKAIGKSIHLITHKKEFNPINSYQTQIVMEDGVTKVDSKMSQN